MGRVAERAAAGRTGSRCIAVGARGSVHGVGASQSVPGDRCMAVGA